MMVLTDIKQYLNIDEDNTIDDFLILSLWETAEDYVRGAITDFDTKITDDGFKAKAEIVEKAIVQELYDNRHQGNTGTKAYSYTIQAMLTQLQYTPTPVTEEG